MKARPILFNTDMVKAVRDDMKSQTRRPIDVPAEWSLEGPSGNSGALGVIKSSHPKKGKFGAFIRREIHPGCGKFEHDIIPCPYGQPGDLLYVRETFSVVPDEENGGVGQVLYLADGNQYGKNTPSIHMPREFSRLTLEITDVRVERLQEISEEDAKAEGVHPVTGPASTRMWERSPGKGGQFLYAKTAFSRLWDSIYSNWDANPWVWVVSFKAHHCNVDALLREREAA